MLTMISSSYVAECITNPSHVRLNIMFAHTAAYFETAGKVVQCEYLEEFQESFTLVSRADAFVDEG